MENDEKKPIFGLKDKESTTWEKYIGRYIMIYPSNKNHIFSGKLISVKEGYGILNPFQGADYGTGKLVRKLIYEDSIVFLPGADIEPTTKESLENFCEITNKKDDEKRENSKNQPA